MFSVRKNLGVVKVLVFVTALSLYLASPRLGGSSVLAQTPVSFQDGVYPDAGYAGTRDTKIRENAPTTNYGSISPVNIDGDDPGGSGKDVYSLVKWDITSIPTGSTVESASLTFDVSNTSYQTYEAYEMKRAWVEGEATWNQYAAGANWETAGAKGAADSGTTVLGSVSPGSVGSLTVNLNASGVALVQSWVNTPSSNHGLIVSDAVNTDGADLSSREHSTATLRPKLTVVYTGN